MALRDLLLDELRDMYRAENQLVKALPKLVKGAKDGALKQLFIANRHLRRTGSKAIVYGFFQVLLAPEVVFCCQDGGVTEKKLYLLQFAAVHMAELCAGSPNVVRGEVVFSRNPPDRRIRLPRISACRYLAFSSLRFGSNIYQDRNCMVILGLVTW